MKLPLNVKLYDVDLEEILIQDKEVETLPITEEEKMCIEATINSVNIPTKLKQSIADFFSAYDKTQYKTRNMVVRDALYSALKSYNHSNDAEEISFLVPIMIKLRKEKDFFETSDLKEAAFLKKVIQESKLVIALKSQLFKLIEDSNFRLVVEKSSLTKEDLCEYPKPKYVPEEEVFNAEELHPSGYPSNQRFG